MIQLLSDAEGKLMCKIIEENTLEWVMPQEAS